MLLGGLKLSWATDPHDLKIRHILFDGMCYMDAVVSGVDTRRTSIGDVGAVITSWKKFKFNYGEGWCCMWTILHAVVVIEKMEN